MAIIKVVNIKKTPIKNLKYIANNEKTLNGYLITGVNCSNNIYKANEKMENINRNYGKKNEVKIKHIIHSFHKDENINPYESHLISMEWYERMFPDNNCVGVMATHDGDPEAKNSADKCIHTHISLNAIDLNGKRLDIDKKWLERAINISNEICKEHGLTHSIIDFKSNAKVRKTLTEIKMEKEGRITFKSLVKKDLDEVLSKVKSYDELIEALKLKGYEIKDGKELSIKNSDYGMVRNIRTKTIGSLYNKESIINKIKENSNIKIISVKNKTYNKWIPREEYKLIHSKGNLSNNIKIAMIILRKMFINNEDNFRRNNNVRSSAALLKEINNLTDVLKIITDNNLTNIEECNKKIVNITLENNKLNNKNTSNKNKLKQVESLIIKLNEVNEKRKELEALTSSTLKKLKNSKKIKILEEEIKEYKDYNYESLNKELKDKREEIQLNDKKIKENIKVKKDIEYVLDINKKVNERFKDVNIDRNKEDIDRNI